MKIWYISKYVAPPKYTRVGTRGYFLCKEFVKLGHDVTLYSSDSNHLAKPPLFSGRFHVEASEGVKVRWIKTKKYTGVRSFSRVLSWLSFDFNVVKHKENGKPDVVIISSLSLTTILVGLYFKLIFKCKLVFEVRDIWPLVLCETGGYSKYNPAIVFLKIIELVGYQFSDLIVGTMPNLQEYIDNTIQTNKNVLCVPHGIDVAAIPQNLVTSNDDVLKYLGQHQKFILCYAGSMGEDNALETLILTAKRLHTFNSIVFLLIGDGDMRHEYEKLARGYKNIVFTGMLPKDDVARILRQVDLLYFATHSNNLSKYGQSLNKVIDYMSAGKVIIGSYSGFPSMINEAECGEFIPENSVEDLVVTIKKYFEMEPKAREEIGLRGRQWLIQERTFQKLALVYERALESL